MFRQSHGFTEPAAQNWGDDGYHLHVYVYHVGGYRYAFLAYVHIMPHECVYIYICIFSYLYTHTSKISDFETQKSECFPSSPVKNSNRMPSGNQTWQWKIPRNGGFYMGKSSNEMVDISYISIYRWSSHENPPFFLGFVHCHVWWPFRKNFDKTPSTGRVGSSLAPRTWAEISPPEAGCQGVEYSWLVN